MMKKKFIIIGISVVILLSVLMPFLFSPIARSYITGIPIHFRLLDANSNKNDIVTMYGEKLGDVPNGVFELYQAEFLGINGYINVMYFENSEQVYLVRFVLRSGDYDTYEDFKKDVDKTYSYFEKVLFRLLKEKSSFEDARDGWSDKDNRVAYKVYNVNEFYDKNGGYYIPDETITVFQFNIWTD